MSAVCPSAPPTHNKLNAKCAAIAANAHAKPHTTREKSGREEQETQQKAVAATYATTLQHSRYNST
jgi:hypothetical protein